MLVHRLFALAALPALALLAAAYADGQPLAPAQREQRLVGLGRALFHDPAMSSNGRVSCATCHPLSHGGTTEEAFTHLGVNGQAAPFNTPSIWGGGITPRLGWRGDAYDVGTIVDRALTKPFLMGNHDVDAVVARLAKDPSARARFAVAGLTPSRAALDDALDAYLRYIAPRGSPAERFFAGDTAALDAEARRGAALFHRVGCASCHTGPAFGGQMLTRFGAAVADPYAGRGQCADNSFCWSDGDCALSGGGRCKKTGLVRDVDGGADGAPGYTFRVPSLLCVGETAPYFHDGSARTLDEAVRVMGRLQLGVTLSDDDTKALVAFLRALTGKLPPGEM